MKLLLLPLLSGICLAPLNNTFNSAGKASALQTTVQGNIVDELRFQDVSEYNKMACVAFKAQDYCRAELEDFDFDAHFTVVSATVYFSGANFKDVEKGVITSNSLKSIKPLMNRCLPGTRVIFDDIKVKGPDNSIRTIPGINLLLF
jgi:hypothetical protein